MGIERGQLIRLGERILTKHQVRLAKRLAEVEPDSEDEYELLQDVDEFSPSVARNIMLLAGDYRTEAEARAQARE